MKDGERDEEESGRLDGTLMDFYEPLAKRKSIKEQHLRCN